MLGGLDLNLLRALQALLESRNVTRAGERLHLSQPATSAALAKLRRHFGDQLLVRVGREFELTPLAQRVLPLATQAVVHVERVFDVRAEFDAASSHQRFQVHASDYAVCVVTEPLRRLVAAEAPHVSVEFLPMPASGETLDALRSDLLIAPVGYGWDSAHDLVLRDRFVAVLDGDHPVLQRATDVADVLASVPHAVGRFGKGIVTPGDRLLEEIGVRRQVAATVSGYVALPMLVLGTDLLAIVPARLAERCRALGRLRILELPGAEQEPLIEAVFWDDARADDPALRWLRTLFVRACESLGPEPDPFGSSMHDPFVSMDRATSVDIHH